MYKGPKTTMYIVRSLNMVNWLCSHGFKILKVEDSEKDEKLKVFFFEESPALHHTMMMYRNILKVKGIRKVLSHVMPEERMSSRTRKRWHIW